MVLRVAWAVILLCGMGCVSVRWSGDNAMHTLNKDMKLNHRYRVERICFTCPPRSRTGNSTMMADILERIGKSDLKSILPKQRPAVFTESNDAIPIVVNMYLKDENSRWELAPYILTLGLLPGETHEDCLLQIDVQRMPDMKRTAGTFITLKYDFKMSLFTPLGLIDFDHDNTVAISRETVSTSREVQPEMIAAAIVDQLYQLENDGQHVAHDTGQTTMRETAHPNAVKSTSMQQQLENLKVLRSAGTITEKEYQEMVLRVVESAK